MSNHSDCSRVNLNYLRIFLFTRLTQNVTVLGAAVNDENVAVASLK